MAEGLLAEGPSFFVDLRPRNGKMGIRKQKHWPKVGPRFWPKGDKIDHDGQIPSIRGFPKVSLLPKGSRPACGILVCERCGVGAVPFVELVFLFVLR